MGFSVVKGDLFEQKYDAIVIPSQPSLKLEGIVGGRAKELCGDVITFEIDQLKKINLTECAVVPSYNLPCKKLILVANPMWKNGNNNEEDDLRESYLNCLNSAMDFGLESIAFPLLSTGSYNFPKRKAIEIAIDTITDYVEDNDIDVALVINSENTYSTYREIFKKYNVVSGHLKKYTEAHINEMKNNRNRFGWYIPNSSEILENGVSKTSFSDALKYFIIQKGLKKEDCYLNVISKTAFQNIYSGNSKPTKNTVISLGINMGLSPDEICQLLSPLGEILDERIERDGIIIEAYWNCEEDVEGVNNILVKNNYPPLKHN